MIFNFTKIHNIIPTHGATFIFFNFMSLLLLPLVFYGNEMKIFTSQLLQQNLLFAF